MFLSKGNAQLILCRSLTASFVVSILPAILHWVCGNFGWLGQMHVQNARPHNLTFELSALKLSLSSLPTSRTEQVTTTWLQRLLLKANSSRLVLIDHASTWVRRVPKRKTGDDVTHGVGTSTFFFFFSPPAVHDLQVCE